MNTATRTPSRVTATASVLLLMAVAGIVAFTITDNDDRRHVDLWVYTTAMRLVKIQWQLGAANNGDGQEFPIQSGWHHGGELAPGEQVNLQAVVATGTITCRILVDEQLLDEDVNTPVCALSANVPPRSTTLPLYTNTVLAGHPTSQHGTT